MRKDVVVPKQTLVKKLDPRFEMTVSSFIRLERDYDLQKLGIELRPLVQKYWAYDPHCAYNINFLDIEYEFLGDDPTPENKDWIVLPAKAEIVVKEDITIERMLETLRVDDEAWSVPNERMDDGFYHFRFLFKNVMSEQRLASELAQLLDDPAFLKSSNRLSLSVINADTDEEIRFEVIVTPYGKWKFARIVAVEYNGSKFEHYLKRPGNTNVYRASSKCIQRLRKSLIVFDHVSASDIALSEDVVKYFIDTPTPQALINREMALRISSKHNTIGIYTSKSQYLAEFKVFEIDYTTFID